MGHGKETPRQKMIGMMYLVLTAMLALNVSKEAVEAFKKIDKGLTKTVVNYEKKNNLTYEEFDRAASENPIKAGPWRSKAYEVKARANELYDYVQGLKIEIITTAEGEGTDAVDGNTVHIEHVTKIDENNIPSEILIGSDENGKANDLRALLNDYRLFLVETIDGRNIAVEESVRESIDTEDGRAPDGSVERWENLTFHSLPLVAVITMLSKIQVDVRNAETDVLNFLYDQIDAASFKFNKIEATVLAKSSYVMRGSSYESEVFIAASDTTKKPEILIGDFTVSRNADGTKTYEMIGSNYTSLEIDEQGRGIFRRAASSIGQKSYKGLIKMLAPDGTVVSYPFEESYSVGAPNVTISATGMNVLYKGLDNPIAISVPSVSNDLIQASMTNGTIKRGSVEGYPGGWVANPAIVGQEASIVVSANVNGERMRFPPYTFRVQRIPPPIAQFAGVSGEGGITKAVAVNTLGVLATQPDFLFDLKYTVTSFTISVMVKGFDRTIPSSNNRITADQKTLIQSLNRGSKLNIIDIRAIGPDKTPRRLNPLIITIN